MALPKNKTRATDKAWTQYSWDPQTEVATFTDEETGHSFTQHQPLMRHFRKAIKR